jgi:Dolichyl-phosphate-mannose-protein mannosyltransferase
MDAVRVWLRGTDVQLIGLTLLTKVLLFGWGLLVVAASQGRAVDIGQSFALWTRWDAPHYLDLAIWGYMAVDPGVSPTFGNQGDMDLMIVFYPLLPALIAAARVVVPDLAAPILISTITSVAAVLLLYRVVARELGEQVGRRAAVFLLIFPTAYFLHIGYTESLFLALVLGTFLAARSNRWMTASVAGGLAALTRVNGLVLVPALAGEAWTEWRQSRHLRPAWGWIGLVLAGFGGYLLLNQVVYGNPFAFVEIQREHWFKTLAWPWEGIAGVVSRLSGRSLEDVLVLGVAELAAIVLGLAGTVVAVRRFRPSWAWWMGVNWLLFVSTSFVLSVPRYVLVLFPLYAWFAILAERRWLGLAIGVASVGLLLWFSARFATGAWAF